MSIGDFLLGLVSPFIASGLLVLIARSMSGRGDSGNTSINLAIPVAVLVLSVAGAAVLWGSRRSVAYGLLVAIGLGLAVSVFWWAGHAASGGTAPPPPSR
jgi:hypothetical protein